MNLSLNRKKVLLLNPPGREDVIRDYYCGHLAKGDYMWPPLDLLVLSGHLYAHCDIVVIDATVTKAGDDESIKRIVSIQPDIIVSLISAVSWQSDINFLTKLRQLVCAPIVLSGDFTSAYPQKALDENECIDAIILDFTECSILEYVQDRENGAQYGIVTRSSGPIKTERKSQPFLYSAPRHELFPISQYHLPHISRHPFTTFLTTFGCMSVCTFCPFERISFKVRDIRSIEEELLYIKSLGIKELFFRDQSFGSHYEHALSVCDLMRKIKHSFSWSCEMRASAAKEDLLVQMKNAGCHTVMFGVESASEEVLKRHKKGITLSQIRNAFSLAKRIGLRTLAHVMMGMDGEDAESQEKLIQLCLELDPQYVSFNIAAPLWNTSFRDQMALDNKIIDPKIEVDSSYEYPVWESDLLSAKEVCRLRREAIRRFYFRPSFMLREFIGAKSHYRRSMMVKEGLNMLQRNKN